MFIVEQEPSREAKVRLRIVKKALGQVPPHFALYATLHPERFKMFLEEIMYLSSHKNINPDFFAFLRYYVASHNGFSYCIRFNETLLLGKDYTAKQLEAIVASKNIPLDKKHQTLFNEAINALDNPKEFTAETLDSLKAIGWSDADIFDAIDHAAFLFKFSKILKAYSKD